MEQQDKKRIDEDWKKQIDKERDQANLDQADYKQPTFEIFVSSLSMQAMIAMGKLENPITKKTEANYDHARFLIDTLEILKEKTENNLTPQEGTLLGEYLFNLRMMYVEAKK